MVSAKRVGRAMKLMWSTDNALYSVFPRDCGPEPTMLPGTLVEHMFDLLTLGVVVSNDGDLALVLWTEKGDARDQRRP